MTPFIARIWTTLPSTSSRPPFWAVNRCGVNWDRWCVQAAVKMGNGWSYGPSLIEFRTKKAAIAEARRRRAIGPPDLDMIAALRKKISGKSAARKRAILATADAAWKRNERDAKAKAKPRLVASKPKPPRMPNGSCHANSEGDCDWRRCPQIRDGEPEKTGRHCPRDIHDEDDEGRAGG